MKLFNKLFDKQDIVKEVTTSNLSLYLDDLFNKTYSVNDFLDRLESLLEYSKEHYEIADYPSGLDYRKLTHEYKYYFYSLGLTIADGLTYSCNESHLNVCEKNTVEMFNDFKNVILTLFRVYCPKFEDKHLTSILSLLSSSSDVNLSHGFLWKLYCRLFEVWYKQYFINYLNSLEVNRNLSVTSRIDFYKIIAYLSTDMEGLCSDYRVLSIDDSLSSMLYIPLAVYIYSKCGNERITNDLNIYFTNRQERVFLNIVFKGTKWFLSRNYICSDFDATKEGNSFINYLINNAVDDDKFVRDLGTLKTNDNIFDVDDFNKLFYSVLSTKIVCEGKTPYSIIS